MKLNLKDSLFKTTLIWLLKVLAAGIVSLAVLSVVAFFYSYTGIHTTNTTKATDYTWLPNQRMNNMKEGFSFIKMDKNGFNNAELRNDKIDILLMGSSHMEAYQVNQNENCSFILNELLPEYYTYNIGISGHTIYRVADNLDNALNKYKPQKYVIIETNTIQLDSFQMKKVLSGESSAIKSYDSGVLFYLQKIPAFKPVYNQIDNWLNTKTSSESFSDSPNIENIVVGDEYKKTLFDFLSIIASESENSRVTPVIVYAPNETLSKDGSLVFRTNDKFLEVYKETCESLGIIFIDMSEPFAEMYSEEKKLAHGFPNTAVGVGHLNKYGHRTVAKTIAEKICRSEGK